MSKVVGHFFQSACVVTGIYIYIYLALPQGQGHHNSVSQLQWARSTYPTPSTFPLHGRYSCCVCVQLAVFDFVTPSKLIVLYNGKAKTAATFKWKMSNPRLYSEVVSGSSGESSGVNSMNYFIS